MPIYEYLCEECKEEIEMIRKISDPPLTECPSCHKNTLIKKTSLSAFHLKGGGWYKDGYSNGDKGPEKKTKEVAKTESSSESTTKKDTSTTKKDTSTTNKSSSSESTPKVAPTPAPASKAS